MVVVLVGVIVSLLPVFCFFSRGLFVFWMDMALTWLAGHFLVTTSSQELLSGSVNQTWFHVYHQGRSLKIPEHLKRSLFFWFPLRVIHSHVIHVRPNGYAYGGCSLLFAQERDPHEDLARLAWAFARSSDCFDAAPFLRVCAARVEPEAMQPKEGPQRLATGRVSLMLIHE